MKQYNLEIETTADGSATLYRSDMDEHYHSVKGALTESEHVYLKLGWNSQVEKRWKQIGKVPIPIRVFEVGFGTGLNAALTAQAALTHEQHTNYFTIELHPLPLDITEKLQYKKNIDFQKAFTAVNNAVWDEDTKINPYFDLIKIEGDLLSIDIPVALDVVYFDAFAPEKQPELWHEEVFRKIFDAMNPGGALVTYCAKGSIRRMLNQIGFITERLPGPPGGKREVLRATKPT